jgi:hypothetical protein
MEQDPNALPGANHDAEQTDRKQYRSAFADHLARCAIVLKLDKDGRLSVRFDLSTWDESTN